MENAQRTKKYLEKIKELRKLKGIKQEEMAEKLGVTLSGYGKMERGATSITLDKLLYLLELLGLRANEFFHEEDLYDIGISMDTELELENSELKLENQKLKNDKEYYKEKLALSNHKYQLLETELEILQRKLNGDHSTQK